MSFELALQQISGKKRKSKKMAKNVIFVAVVLLALQVRGVIFYCWCCLVFCTHFVAITIGFRLQKLKQCQIKIDCINYIILHEFNRYRTLNDKKKFFLHIPLIVYYWDWDLLDTKIWTY